MRAMNRPVEIFAPVLALLLVLVFGLSLGASTARHDTRYVPAPLAADPGLPVKAEGHTHAEDDQTRPELPAAKRANEREEDQKPYDTSRVLEGASPNTIPCYTPQNGGPRALSDILIGVVHVTVSLNRPGLADGNGLCGFFRSVKASPNWTVDNEGNSWENVPLTRVPWTQVDFNRRACSIEFVGSTGRPKEGPAQWTDVQLRTGARLMARCFVLAHIPPRQGAVSGSRVIKTGIRTHQQLGLAGGGHTNPGPYFNMARFQSYVAEYMGVARPIPARYERRCRELNKLRRSRARRIREKKTPTLTARQRARSSELRRNFERRRIVCSSAGVRRR